MRWGEMAMAGAGPLHTHSCILQLYRQRGRVRSGEGRQKQTGERGGAVMTTARTWASAKTVALALHILLQNIHRPSGVVLRGSPLAS